MKETEQMQKVMDTFLEFLDEKPDARAERIEEDRIARLERKEEERSDYQQDMIDAGMREGDFL